MKVSNKNKNNTDGKNGDNNLPRQISVIIHTQRVIMDEIKNKFKHCQNVTDETINDIDTILYSFKTFVTVKGYQL